MSVPDSLAGRPEKCPNCGYFTNVPGQAMAMGNEGTVMCGPEGIGGWLILPAIGLVLSPIRLLFYLCLAMSMYGPTLLGVGTILIDLAFMCYIIFVAIIFFLKKRWTPAAVVLLLIVNLVISLSTGEIAIMARATVVGAVWIPYFMVSKRVKNTFTE